MMIYFIKYLGLDMDIQFDRTQNPNLFSPVDPLDYKSTPEQRAQQDARAGRARTIYFNPNDQKRYDLVYDREIKILPSVQRTGKMPISENKDTEGNLAADLFTTQSNGNIKISVQSKRDLYAKQIVDLALRSVGRFTYKYGSTSGNFKTFSGSFDCSSFVSGVFNYFGLKLPRSTSEIYKFLSRQGRIIPKAQAKPGDIVFHKGNNKMRSNHVEIYLGNGQSVGIGSTGKPVRIKRNSDYGPREHIYLTWTMETFGMKNESILKETAGVGVLKNVNAYPSNQMRTFELVQDLNRTTLTSNAVTNKSQLATVAATNINLATPGAGEAKIPHQQTGHIFDCNDDVNIQNYLIDIATRITGYSVKDIKDVLTNEGAYVKAYRLWSSTARGGFGKQYIGPLQIGEVHLAATGSEIMKLGPKFRQWRRISGMPLELQFEGWARVIVKQRKYIDEIRAHFPRCSVSMALYAVHNLGPGHCQYTLCMGRKPWDPHPSHRSTRYLKSREGFVKRWQAQSAVHGRYRLAGLA